MKINTLFRRLAQDSGDYPIPVADAAERLQELRPAPPLTFVPTAFKGRLDPEADPSYCCEAHEQLGDRLRRFGGAGAVGEDVADAFERRVRALDTQCPKAVAS